MLWFWDRISLKQKQNVEGQPHKNDNDDDEEWEELHFLTTSTGTVNTIITNYQFLQTCRELLSNSAALRSLLAYFNSLFWFYWCIQNCCMPQLSPVVNTNTFCSLSVRHQTTRSEQQPAMKVTHSAASFVRLRVFTPSWLVLVCVVWGNKNYCEMYEWKDDNRMWDLDCRYSLC